MEEDMGKRFKDYSEKVTKSERSANNSWRKKRNI